MKREELPYPATLFVSTMLRKSITEFRQGSKNAEKFLFEGNILRRFLDYFNFSDINVDDLRNRIKSGKKIIKLL